MINTQLQKNKTVFIVHGRNLKARDAIIQVLNALLLDHLDWEKAAELTGKTAPSTLEIVEKGIHQASATIVLLTPDEQACLRDQFASSDDDRIPGFQPRQNVILEAGIAHAISGPEHTIFVKMGQVREISDLAGINYIQLDNRIEKRNALANRLKVAGCDLVLTGQHLNPNVAGDFDSAIGVSVSGIESKLASLLEVQIVEREDIFNGAIDFLKKRPRREVLIYAPTGVWVKDAAKKRWFNAIAGSLLRGLNKPDQTWPRDADKSVTTSLGHFVGVYGLPIPPVDSGQDRYQDLRRFSKALDYMERLFAPFNGLESVELYYLNTDVDTIPGTGAIIIDNAVAIGYAVNVRYKVDYALFLPEEQHIAANVRNWFKHHVLKIVHDNVIQSMKDGKSMKEGLDDIRENYGLARKRKRYYV